LFQGAHPLIVHRWPGIHVAPLLRQASAVGVPSQVGAPFGILQVQQPGPCAAGAGPAVRTPVMQQGCETVAR
jgi:hypothetical protein